MLRFFISSLPNVIQMAAGIDEIDWSRVVLLLAVVGIVLLAGCVQGQDGSGEDDGFDPSGSGNQNAGTGGGNADDGSGDDANGSEQTRLERARALGFDELTAEDEVLRLMSERRQSQGMRPLEESQSLKVAADRFSRDLSNRTEIKERVDNGTVIEIEVTEKEMRERYLEHNAFDCQKGVFLTGQTNHVTLFNRTLRTSKERLIRYDNAELLALGVVEDWMESDARSTVLNEGFRQGGVGIYFEPSTDIVYVTANFC